MLIKQRQEEKMKWEKELREGREFIKNEFNKRYCMGSNSSIMREDYEG
jgi:hypothetical protein